MADVTEWFKQTWCYLMHDHTLVRRMPGMAQYRCKKCQRDHYIKEPYDGGPFATA